jgi:hypothetical protein
MPEHFVHEMLYASINFSGQTENHLYGLTYDEVLIVDPATPITREEYEKESEN